MKNKVTGLYKSIGFFITAFFLSVVAFAQEKGIDVDINIKKENEWYQRPWVWVVGAAVFILLLVAILKSGKKTD
jgi:hypothetical protein